MLTALLGRIVNREGHDVWTEARHVDADDRLVDAARLGNPDAFAVIYQRYKLDVWHLAWFTLRDHHDAEDVTQETFLKAHRALGQYQRAGALRPWLLTICRNACRDRLRAAQRHDVVALDEELAALATPGGGASGDERERDIDFHRALAALPGDDREAFVLVDVLGCTSDEAARIAGLRAASTLRSRLTRARRALAPAVQEPSDVRFATEVWGLFHTAGLSALVLSEDAVVDEAARRPDSLLTTLAGDARAAAGGAATDVVSFLERLDRTIPGDRTVLAVVDERPPGASPWLAGHPRWRMQRATTHASWVGEVDATVARCLPCTEQDRRRLRQVLEADAGFIWTGRP